jgi:thymidylate synthase (FAD)
MRIAKPYVRLITPLTQEQAVDIIATAYSKPRRKVFYDGEDKLSAIAPALALGHHSLLEHVSLTVEGLTTIACYKELTRHRHLSFTIESTLHSSYTKEGERELVFIQPTPTLFAFAENCTHWEEAYFNVLENTNKETARDILPQCTGAYFVMSGNLRALRYLIGLRTSPDTSFAIRRIASLLWLELNRQFPFFFPLTKEEIDAGLPIEQEYITRKQRYGILEPTEAETNKARTVQPKHRSEEFYENGGHLGGGGMPSMPDLPEFPSNPLPTEKPLSDLDIDPKPFGGEMLGEGFGDKNNENSVENT